MSLQFITSEKHKYVAETIGTQVNLYRAVNDRQLYIGDCWMDARTAFPRWFIQQHGLTAQPTNASSPREAALLLIASIEKFEAKKKGNPLATATREMLADVRSSRSVFAPVKGETYPETAGRAKATTVRGVRID